MPEPRRWPSLGESMVLIAATGVGLATLQAVIGAIPGGSTFLLGLRPITPPGGWTADALIVAGTDLLITPLPFVGAWSPVLLLLSLRYPAPARRRAFGRPGLTACLAATFGMVLAFVVMLATAGIGVLVEGALRRGPIGWLLLLCFEDLLVYAGVAVASSWATLAASGRWRPQPDWIDRMGRVVGVIWLVCGLAWGTRHYLRLL